MVSPMNFLVNSRISSTLLAEYLFLLPPIGNRPSYPKEVGEANPAVAVPCSYWEADVTSPGSLPPLVVLASPVSAMKARSNQGNLLIIPHQQLFDSPIVRVSSNPELSTGLASCLRRRRN